MEASSYRPRNPGHDYYGQGTYLITLVVSGRERLLAEFTNAGFTTENGREGRTGESGREGRTGESGREGRAGGSGRESGMGGRNRHETLRLTPLGAAIEQAWQAIPALQAGHGNRVAILACVCMPDHFHGVIEVLEPMHWSLGDIIQAFKAACTSQWQQQQGLPTSLNRPISGDCRGERAPAWLREKAAMHSSEGALIRNLSKRQRQEYYTFVSRQRRPLFDDNYDDTVCLDDRHRQAMIAYVRDNPRRALLRRQLPDLMQRCLHVQIGGRSYGAFGNLFLLRWPRKLQVMCHRKHPISHQPYEKTADYAADCRHWETAIMEGGTVIVTTADFTTSTPLRQKSALLRVRQRLSEQIR